MFPVKHKKIILTPMDKKNNKGLFITLEGGEGCGKSTQSKLLSNYLLSHDIACILTREPGGTASAEAIRALLVNQNSDYDFLPTTELLLHNAARYEHLHKTILPALDNKISVICDRFYDSTLAYQVYGHGLPLAQAESIQQNIINNIKPDITFILDIETEAGLKRANKRIIEATKQLQKEDRYEAFGLEFHKKVREGFLQIAQKEPDRCIIIDATQSITKIHNEIIAKIENFLYYDIKLSR